MVDEDLEGAFEEEFNQAMEEVGSGAPEMAGPAGQDARPVAADAAALSVNVAAFRWVGGAPAGLSSLPALRQGATCPD